MSSLITLDQLQTSLEEVKSSMGGGAVYCTCSTDASVSAKEATVVRGTFVLEEGVSVLVKFANKNSASSPTLNVNSTGAKSIVIYGTTAVYEYMWYPDSVVQFTYDGTSYVMENAGYATTTYYGPTKLSSSTSSNSISEAATPSAVKSAYDLASANALSGTVGSTTQPIYLNDGTLTAMSGTLSKTYGGTGNTTGTATYITTTADTGNALYPIGVTSSATTTAKRDTSITMTGGVISASSLTTSGNVTSTGGNFVLPNGGVLYAKDSSGTNRTIASLSESDTYSFGTGGTINSINIGTTTNTDDINLRSKTTNISGVLCAKDEVDISGVVYSDNSINTASEFYTDRSNGFGFRQSTNNYTLSLGIASSGNRGVYDEGNGCWIVYKNTSENQFLRNPDGNIGIIANCVDIYTISAKTTDDTGYSFRFFRTASTDYSPSSSTAVLLCGGSDSTSAYIRSYPTYSRTGSTAANVNITSSGTFNRYSSSASRYKNTINYFDNINNASDEGLAKRDYSIEESTYREDYRSILKIPVVQFHYNEGYMTGEADYDYTKFVTGFIAEDVEKNCPECATYTEEGEIEAWDHMQMIPRMVAMIQELNNRVVELEDKIVELTA